MEKPINLFNPLIVWNSPCGVDVLRTEKPRGSFAEAETEKCPRVKL